MILKLKQLHDLYCSFLNPYTFLERAFCGMLNEIISILKDGPLTILQLRDKLLERGYNVTFERVKEEVTLLQSCNMIKRTAHLKEFNKPTYSL